MLVGTTYSFNPDFYHSARVVEINESFEYGVEVLINGGFPPVTVKEGWTKEEAEEVLCMLDADITDYFTPDFDLE